MSSSPSAFDSLNFSVAKSSGALRVLVLVENDADVQRLGEIRTELCDWTVDHVRTIEDALLALKSGVHHAWVLDSQIASTANVDLMDLTNAENIDAAMVLLVDSDHPFAPAEGVVDWAHVLVRPEFLPISFEESVREAVAKQQVKVTQSRLSRRDNLTGLLNRVGLSEVIRRARQRAVQCGTKFGVCFVEVGGFQAVNARSGTQVGDDLLKVVGRRLASAVRPGDAVARLEGETFVAVFDGVESIEEGEHIAERLRDVIQPPYHLRVPLTSVAARVGLAIYPDSVETPEAMIRVAEWVMLENKRGETNRAETIEAYMPLLRLGRATDGTESIDWGSLEVALQPQIDIVSGRAFAVEALARWTPEDPGTMDVAESIRALESNGMIFELDLWMLENALEACQPHWPRIDRVAVNISPVTLLTPGFLERLSTFLPRGSGCLEIELTETALLPDLERAAKVLHVLRALGVRVALDDFGRGYSSLLRLQELPLDTVKLDKEFVCRVESDLRARAIIESMITLTERLSLDVVVEGVETRAQVEQLITLGISKAQGYLYGRPMSSLKLGQWFEGDFGEEEEQRKVG